MIIDILHSTEYGREIVSVPLRNSTGRAILYAEDFTMLLNLGLAPTWVYEHQQVFSGKVSVARLIVDAGPRQQVIYCDKDTCNLRRDNLAVTVGNGKFRAREMIRANQRANKFELKHMYPKQHMTNIEAETAMSD
jgi:hypothetical protein